MDETKYWLWLSMIFGTGSRRIWEAMRLFSTAEEAYYSLIAGNLNERLNTKEIDAIHCTPIEKAIQLMDYCGEKGIELTGYSDYEYPRQLRHILNPPAVLYYRGNISCLTGTRTVTSVGTRKASDYSLRAASRICRELAGNGVVIVSGFAVGIDIASHLAAAEINRPTACVLGCGVDVDYPRENFRFRDIILNNGGVFISEFPPGTAPHSPNFPKRNRILSALGRVTVVFEASEKSGSLITASLAASCGRDVFCLPPADIFSGAFSGNIAYLRDGARPLYSSQDILDCFKIGGALDREIRMNTYEGFSGFGVREIERRNRKYASSVNDKKKKHTAEKEEKITEPKKSAAETAAESNGENIDESILCALSPVQRSIAELLRKGEAVHADEISRRLELDSSELMTELTELELIGIIRSLPGKMFEII